MKKGEKVKIFEKPATCEKFECDAILVKNLNCDVGPCEYWEVKTSDGYKISRWINVQHPKGFY